MRSGLSPTTTASSPAPHPPIQAALANATAANAANAANAGARRFDYERDPVAWFFQNQIRSEEEFAARKAELRAAARARLDKVFAKKGKRLVVDSEEDGAGGAGGDGDGGAWSVDESELSAWDSDVASVSALGGAVKDWRAVSGFSAPAEAALQLALWATMVSAVCIGGERGLATGRMKLGGRERIDIQ